MKLSQRTKIALLFAGDILALYLSLFLTVGIRYGAAFPREIGLHLAPFSLIFVLWVIVFYVAGLYDLRRLRNNLDFLKIFALTLSLNALFTIALFYLIPLFGIAPRRNLFIFLIAFTVIEAVWRRSFNIRASFREGLVNVLLLGGDKSNEEIVKTLRENPQFGYDIKVWLKKGARDPKLNGIPALIKKHDINLIVAPRATKKDAAFARTLYGLLASGVLISDLAGFYEMVFRKVPLRDVEEGWFLENKIGERKFYDDLKRAAAFLATLILLIVLAPLIAVIGLLIKLTSPGPVIYKQVRVGERGREFILYKFRTMRADAEKEGARWAEKDDRRVTPTGRLLRRFHLDELPQLVNILKGDLSFVGPRPERPEFVRILEEKIPYYDIRHVVKPGVTGWAQINYRYGASIEDAYEKLEYDIYYLENRSFVLDIAIILKTLKTFFVEPK